jgi:hypothetical protein
MLEGIRDEGYAGCWDREDDGRLGCVLPWIDGMYKERFSLVERGASLLWNGAFCMPELIELIALIVGSSSISEELAVMGKGSNTLWVEIALYPFINLIIKGYKIIFYVFEFGGEDMYRS